LGGMSVSILPYFPPPSKIGVRTTPGHKTPIRTPLGAASARRQRPNDLEEWY
jgi:hypothetical protein